MNSFNTINLQSPQPARDNRSAAQRRYRKKEEDGFLQLREALKEVAKDDPRTRQDILRRDAWRIENQLLSQQKALIEACNSPRDNYKYGHPQSPSCGNVISEDPLEWWSHDRTKMANITWTEMAHHRVLDAAMSPNVTTLTAQDYEWFTQLYNANMVQDNSRLNHPWPSHQSGDFTTRPHSGSGYYARCANCQHGESL
ncbi:hypothetical protein DFJ58DRAFT_799523 [Suillus subalutaceus]|uniref:uncharacterized protein n=1 Tax=Suillus subalutaceus TaxID=48586 RepID=UPI001B87C4C4|nr:uncharacterized protein DFJ58DRAFT_799523 [Suillus subalutaceus]KAG1846222.1 hypothetical protein DFJ58DRAFT_799523 [Suillus subalutaceus]